MTTALIVDDEPLARTHLLRLLEKLDVEVVGEAENAAQALQLTEELQPEIVFMDIRMRGLTGMQAARALLDIEPSPLLVFVTGYSEHAVSAFEHDALDYLIKPVTPERLARTLTRARERLKDQHLRNRMREEVDQQVEEQAAPMRRLPVRKDYSVRLIRIEEILCATARDKRVFVRTASGEHRTYYTLAFLETVLPVEQFCRIHESCIVNLESVEEIIFLGSHSYVVQLTNGTQLPVGRTRYSVLQQRLGLSALPTS